MKFKVIFRKCLPAMAIGLTLVGLATANVSYAEKSKVKPPKIDQSVGQYAYLRDKLPDNAVAYLRVAQPVVHFFSAKNRTNDQALQHRESVKALESFRAVLGDQALLTAQLEKIGFSLDQYNQEMIHYLATWLYRDLNGPIEAMVVDKGHSISAMSQGLIIVPVAIDSVAKLNQILADNPINPDLVQLNAQGFGTYEQASFYFNAEEQRLFVMMGVAPISFEVMQTQIAKLKHQREHEMYTFENQIDLTGQSNFLWLDLRNKAGILSAPIGNMAVMELLQQVEGVALGEGTNEDAQGQMKIIVKGNMNTLLALDPKRKNDFNFETVEAPLGAVILPIPTQAMVEKALYTSLASQMPAYLVDETVVADFQAEAKSLYQNIQAKLSTELGFDPMPLLNALGPTMTLYYDDLGPHAIIGLRDKKPFYQWLNTQNEAGLVQYDQKGKMHHLVMQNPLIPLLVDKMSQDPKEDLTPLVFYPFINEYVANSYGVRALDLNWHFYWTEEGDYIRINRLPQMVMEEDRLGNEKFGKWLERSQGIKPQEVLFAGTMNIKNGDRNWYYNYLQFLQNSADVLGIEFDVNRMPRADQFDFAESSRVGLQLSANDQFLYLSLDYGADPSTSIMSTLLFTGSSIFISGMLAGFLEQFPIYESIYYN